MCFHTSTKDKVKRLEAHYGVDISNAGYREVFDTPRYHLNGFSHPNMLVIPQHSPKHLAPGVWGIVPTNKTKSEIKDYYKESVRYGSGLNARSEKLFSNYLYKTCVMEQRCIIPVSGFFEPHEHQKKKYPYFIKNKDGNPLSLAGIYSVIDHTFITFSILTKAASPLFEHIHNLKNRQPVILDTEAASTWVSPNLTETDIQDFVRLPFDDAQLESYTVSKDVFSPKAASNRPSIIERMDYPEFQTLF